VRSCPARPATSTPGLVPGFHKRPTVTDLNAFSVFPDFSPAGDRIAFTTTPNPFTPADIATIDRDGAGLRLLTADPAADRYPAYSPDGRRIVFLSDRSGVFQVWIMDADGHDQRQLTFDAAPKDQVPDWSPVGSKIAYVASPRGGPGGDSSVGPGMGTVRRPVGGLGRSRRSDPA